jgi:DNA-binding GntR family transcriptional regulator
MTETARGWVQNLSAERDSLSRSSTAELVADILRRHVIEGRVQPGSRLSEDAVAGALAVSRNTLREAFRLLSHERLLVHELNRGVFVRQLSVGDVVDVYRMRRVIEVASLLGVGPQTYPLFPHVVPRGLAELRAAVTAGKAAAERGDWHTVGTANMHFHQAIAGLAGSPRTNELMSQLLAELRLVFHVMQAPQAFHEPYLEDNERICGLVESGDGASAARMLADYLERAEQQLVRAYADAERVPPAATATDTPVTLHGGVSVTTS